MNSNEAVFNHRQATRALLQAGMEQLKTEQPEEYQLATEAVQRGGHFQVSAALAPTGLDELLIDLVTASGERINLLRVENESSITG